MARPRIKQWSEKSRLKLLKKSVKAQVKVVKKGRNHG
jgi:hypothetical protein